MIRDLANGQETVLDADGMLKATPRFSADGTRFYFVGGRETTAASNDIYAVPVPPTTGKPKAVTSGPGFKTDPTPVTGGRYLVFQAPTQSPFPTGQAGAGGAVGGRGGGGGGGGAARPFGVLALADSTTRTFTGSVPVIAADGSTLAFVSRAGTDYLLQAIKLGGSLEPVTVKKSADAISIACLLAGRFTPRLLDALHAQSGDLLHQDRRVGRHAGDARDSSPTPTRSF